MRLTTFDSQGNDHVGALIGDDATIVDLTLAAPSDPAFESMRTLIAAGKEGLERASKIVAAPPDAAMRTIAGTCLRAPIPDPPRMRDCALFIAHLDPSFKALARRHAASANDPEAEFERLISTGRYETPKVFRDRVIYYNADRLSISGPGSTVTAPRFADEIDYELELGVVLGRTGRDITVADAREYIFGYTIFNDWSLRDVQAHVMTSNLGPAAGKDFDGGTTLGPCIVTADEIDDPYQLAMSARVNGKTWSTGNSSTMEHSFETAIAQFSCDSTVYAGEVLGSGTVLSGSGFEVGRRLNDGDVVELDIERIGVLRNQVAYLKNPN